MLDRPYPRHLPSPRRSDLVRRAGQVVWVQARHFGPVAVTAAVLARRHGVRRVGPTVFVPALRRTFEDLGTTFVKFGQLIASAPGVFGDEVAEEFRGCLDTGSAVPFAEVRRVVEDELGRTLDDAFAWFDPEPIGRASIAVVHRARLHDGRDVAVKVLRPGIEAQIAVDLDLFEPLLHVVARLTGEYVVSQMLQLLDGFRVQLGEELDLRNEARVMAVIRDCWADLGLDLVVVPEVFPDWSGSRVLTMEFFDAVPIDDLSAFNATGIDPSAAVMQAVQALLVTVIRWGVFHGDVHAGNLLVLPDGRLAVIDWGIVGRLDPLTHRFFRRIVEAALGDDQAWPDIAEYTMVTFEPLLAQIDMDRDALALFLQMTLQPLLTRPFGEVSLSAVVLAPQQAIAQARGFATDQWGVGVLIRRFREQRRLRLVFESEGIHESEFERGLFLLTKALLYFERYGRLYFADQSIFANRAVYLDALSHPVPDDPVSGSGGSPVGEGGAQ